ncbi:MAG: hypothetical protein DRP01_00080 [Archaeoglobales archaeon]|nr:MAG: hypothetical protein DRP01_00080 [Archaeoglobales archaeon]
MKVTFYLVAMTRQECTITREVPDDTTDAMLDAMALDIRESADGSEYTEDMEYWEEEPARWEKVKCNCVVRHANTPEERKEIEDRIEYRKRNNDLHGIEIMELQLENSRCPARPASSSDEG